MHEPFDFPPRTRLYTPADLFGELDPARPASYTETFDFRVFRAYVASGGALSTGEGTRAQALHDHSILVALRSELTRPGIRVVAIMGGHRLERGAAAYLAVAELAWALARRGFFVLSGGGPGAMEATHLGALYARRELADVRAAVELLARTPALAHELAGIVRPDGSVDEELVRRAHAWFVPTWRIACEVALAGDAGRSIAVPTWHYGHEPSTPLATDIAKYFQNSIREDGLLAVATSGVIFAPGSAGTTQEIFQDAAQNHYQTFGPPSPMVFLDGDYWTDRYPALPLLRALLSEERYAEIVRVESDREAIVDFLDAFPRPQSPADRIEKWQQPAS